MDRNNSGKVSALMLFALFTVALLLALVAGVRVYGSLVSIENEAKAERFATGLIANSVRGADAMDSVGQADGPQGPALVLTERSQGGAFETRLYMYNGQLMQECSLQGSPFNPDTATPVMKTDDFWFTLDGRLLTVGTDAGCTTIALRSVQSEVGL